MGVVSYDWMFPTSLSSVDYLSYYFREMNFHFNQIRLDQNKCKVLLHHTMFLVEIVAGFSRQWVVSGQSINSQEGGTRYSRLAS